MDVMVMDIKTVTRDDGHSLTTSAVAAVLGLLLGPPGAVAIQKNKHTRFKNRKRSRQRSVCASHQKRREVTPHETRRPIRRSLSAILLRSKNDTVALSASICIAALLSSKTVQ